MSNCEWNKKQNLAVIFAFYSEDRGNVQAANAATKPDGAPNVVILRLAKHAEGPLKCNARFPAGAGAICKCEVPRRLRGSE